MNINQFRFRHRLRVRNYEVDWQGVVHNTIYLLYCEIGRVEYLRHIGAELDLNSINSVHRIVLSRNEIDYKNPARFDSELEICTRIPEIGNTSFIFEGLIIDVQTGDTVVENRAYHVWLDASIWTPVRVPEDFRKLVRNYEGSVLSERDTILRP